MTTPKPAFNVVGDVYSFSWPGIEISLDRFSEGRDNALSAEMTVYSRMEPHVGLLHRARFNLDAATTRKTVAEMLGKREAISGIDWPVMLEQVCFLATERWRTGEPAIDLWSVAPQQARWLLHPYIEVGSPTVLFAKGGSGKSVVALAMAYTVAAGLKFFVGKTDGIARPVLYLDWETSAEVHNERARAIASKHGGAQPRILYKRMSASLQDSAGAIRKEIAKHGVKLVVVDSLGYAGGGEPKDAGIAIALFGAIRTFGVATLCVHHRRKDTSARGSDPDSLFGSAYYFNSARHVWELRGAKDEDNDELGIGLIHAKSNNGRLQKRHGFKVKFTNDDLDITTGISFRYEETLARIPGLEKDASLKDRIVEELTENGAKTAAQIAEALEANPATVQKDMSRLSKLGKVVSVEGHRWGIRTAVNE